MAAATTAIAPDNTTDATFRLWGKGISDQFAAMGLVQTADTGQINWATVLKPAGAGAAQGYEIWRFADALQGTTPVYIKVEYGSSANGATNPGLWFTVGFSTNGAGTITSGNMIARTAAPAGGTSGSVTAFTSYFSGTSARVGVILWANHTVTTETSAFSLERTKDASGADTATGVLCFIASGNAGAITLTWQYLPAAGPVPNTETRFPAVLTNNPTSAFGAVVGYSPAFPMAGSLQNPGYNLLTSVLADFPGVGATISTSVYGASHTYIGTTANFTSPAGGVGTLIPSRLLMIYE